MNKNILIKLCTSLINSVKEALNEDNAHTPAQITLTEYILKDGTKINVNGSLEPGTIVTDSEGNPIADGEYIMEDGSLLRAESGIITEYVPAPATDKVEEKKAEIPVEQKIEQKIEEKSKEKSKEDSDQLNKLVEVLQSQIKELNEKFEVQTKVNIELNKQIQLVSDQPAAKPLVATDEKAVSNDENKIPSDPYERDMYFTKMAEARLKSMKKK